MEPIYPVPAATSSVDNGLGWEVPPLIQEASHAFKRDLPMLLTTHPRQWVAYRGAQRLKFGNSKPALIREFLSQGLSTEEFVVYRVEPPPPDDDEPVKT